MSIHFVQAYWLGLVGAIVGLAAGLLVIRPLDRRSRLSSWDTRTTLPLIFSAGAAHLFLISAVEQQRQILFGLYVAALFGVIAFALVGIRIWRLGAIVFPVGSLAAYAYFGLLVHQVDYIGLLVKLIEVAAVVSALVPLFNRRLAGARLTPT